MVDMLWDEQCGLDMTSSETWNTATLVKDDDKAVLSIADVEYLSYSDEGRCGVTCCKKKKEPVCWFSKVPHLFMAFSMEHSQQVMCIKQRFNLWSNDVGDIKKWLFDIIKLDSYFILHCNFLPYSISSPGWVLTLLPFAAQAQIGLCLSKCSWRTT